MALITKYVFRGNCTTEEVTDGGEQQILIEGPCYSCGTVVSVTVKPQDYARFEAGNYVQDCFPYLPASEREFLLSGICNTCWNAMFPPDEEEDE
jgi:hypothetical protein